MCCCLEQCVRYRRHLRWTDNRTDTKLDRAPPLSMSAIYLRKQGTQRLNKQLACTNTIEAQPVVQQQTVGAHGQGAVVLQNRHLKSQHTTYLALKALLAGLTMQ